VAVIGCFRSIAVESFAAITTVLASKTEFSDKVNVACVAAVLAITMLVTTVVVADGTVYRVVLVVVVAAPRKRVFDTVAISYYTFQILSLNCVHYVFDEVVLNLLWICRG
jgi:hypothetical protein